MSSNMLKEIIWTTKELFLTAKYFFTIHGDNKSRQSHGIELTIDRHVSAIKIKEQSMCVY